MNLFSSAVKRLTFWYVAVLLVVCILFSFPTYILSVQRIEGGARRQTQIIQNLPAFRVGPGMPPRFEELENLRDEQIARDRRSLLINIVIANVLILGFGAYVSYRFAKRTLQPIEEAHTAQARFSTDASHELRTPLAVMRTEIDVALRDKKLNVKTAKQVLASNLEEIARLQRLSEQLLHLSRLDGQSIDKHPVQLSKIVQEEIEQSKKNYGLVTKSSIAKNVHVNGDANLLRELVKIMLDNAAKYGKGNEVRIDLKKRDDSVALSIIDHGIGIQTSELKHVFDRFYRGSNASRHNSSGHGLGLSLAQQITHIHGGTITAASKLGTQTAFEVKLPA